MSQKIRHDVESPLNYASHAQYESLILVMLGLAENVIPLSGVDCNTSNFRKVEIEKNQVSLG